MKRFSFFMFIILACSIAPQSTFAADAEAEAAPKKQSTRSKMIFGPPVNVNIAGAGSMPNGVLLTVLNASFADRTSSIGGNSLAPDVFSQTWFLKIRYGITDYLEIWSTTPYINNSRSNPEPNPSVLHGVGDIVAGLTFCPLHERRADLFTLSASAAAILPTGAEGSHHPPGFGSAGFRAQAGIGKFLTKNLKIETEGVFATRFEHGNQDVRPGNQFQWNTQIRYLFDYFDVGLESTLIRQASSDMEVGQGIRYMRNGTSEWYVGPSANVAIEPLGMWMGVGVFLPVMQHADSPTKMEDFRFEVKVGKLW